MANDTVQPGGSTIHVEHARGLKNVTIENNQCRKSILAGGVDGMIIRGNTVEGRLVGNGNTNLIDENHFITKRFGNTVSTAISTTHISTAQQEPS